MCWSQEHSSGAWTPPPAADKMAGLQQQSETLEAETRNQKTEEHAALFLSAVSKGS